MAIKRVFGEHARKLSISSTKSQLGHLLGASGGVELVLTRAGAARFGHSADDQSGQSRSGLRPGLHAEPGPRSRELRAAMSNSFGFGGHNASVIVGQLRNGTH